MTRSPALLLMAMMAAMQIAFATWMVLQYNFAAEVLDFSAAQLGLQQSVREVPGFLSFAAVFLLFVMREQVLAYVSLVLLAVGVMATGWWPTVTGFLVLTFVSSVGFHYYETMNQSLTLQWLSKKEAPRVMGRILAVSGVAQLAAYALIFLAGRMFELDFNTLFVVAGGATLVAVAWMWWAWPVFPEGTPQTRAIVVRRRYWLYYALVFMGGARRQIFVVFAAWMMVERFGYAFHDVAALFFVNAGVLMLAGPLAGRMVERLGERRALIIEYVGLFAVFSAYAVVSNAWIAVALYIVDHALFALAIAQKTYFQKIAIPSDVAATAGVAFSINHVAAVVIPVLFGFLWLYWPALVFGAGAAMALVSLGLASFVPRDPKQGEEVAWPGARANLAQV